MMAGFEDIIGYETVKQELRRIAGSLSHPETYKRLGVRVPGGLLIYGEPGVGKTLMAEALISESGRKSYTIRKNQPDGDFIKYISTVFSEAAENAPSIVFLDDMDKFANGDAARPDCEEYVAVQAGIDEVRSRGVFVLTTANSILDLPRSLCRPGRFDRLIEIEDPRGEDAERIICHYLEGKKVLGDVDCRTISHLMDGSSCAELEALINEAGLYAGFEGADFISMDHVVSACLRTEMKMSGKIIKPENRDENGLSGPDELISQVCFHEAGHTVISEILCPGSVNLAVIHEKNGSCGGFASVWQDKSYMPLYWKKSRIYSALGGMAAVEQRFGVSDAGAGHDIEQAFGGVKSLVCDDCLYGFGFHRCGRESSPALIEAQEKVISGKLEEFYRSTKEILCLNSEFLEKTALALGKNGILTAGDIAMIRESCAIHKVEI